MEIGKTIVIGETERAGWPIVATVSPPARPNFPGDVRWATDGGSFWLEQMATSWEWHPVGLHVYDKQNDTYRSPKNENRVAT